MPAKVSFNIELGPDLSNEVMDVARKQGEDPERVKFDIEELRNMIFGNLTGTKLKSIEFNEQLRFKPHMKLLSHRQLILTDNFAIHFFRTRHMCTTSNR